MFFVFAMPRSRTKWLSEFLSYGDVLCHHELVSTLRSLDELSSMGRNGTSDTFGTSLWKPISTRYPNARYVVIRRDPAEVADSLKRQGVETDVAAMARTLDAACDELPALVIDYDHINYRLADIWQHCRGDRMPYGREDMRDTYIAEPVKDQLARVDYDNLRSLQCSA